VDNTVTLYCATCAGPRRFERPPCPDGHGADCPEWACLRCGGALLVAPFTVRLAQRREVATTRRRRAA